MTVDGAHTGTRAGGCGRRELDHAEDALKELANAVESGWRADQWTLELGLAHSGERASATSDRKLRQSAELEVHSLHLHLPKHGRRNHAIECRCDLPLLRLADGAS